MIAMCLPHLRSSSGLGAESLKAPVPCLKKKRGLHQGPQSSPKPETPKKMCAGRQSNDSTIEELRALLKGQRRFGDCWDMDISYFGVPIAKIVVIVFGVYKGRLLWLFWK